MDFEKLKARFRPGPIPERVAAALGRLRYGRQRRA
jgi:hypothetical protein